MSVRPTVLAGCMDCGFRVLHRTISDARVSLEAHSFDAPGHRALVSDDRGWHRVFGEWFADGPRVSGGVLGGVTK